MGYLGASKDYDIIINDPTLTEHGFTKFSLPLNGNTVMAVHNTDKSKMMYPKFYISDLQKTVQSLKDKIVSDGILIDDDTADSLVSYFRNAGVLLAEDPDSIFFKNGASGGSHHSRGSGGTTAVAVGNGKSKAKKSQEIQEIISKSQVYKLGDHFLAEAVIIGEHNLPYWITSESLTGQISIQQFIDVTDDLDGKQNKHLYPPRRPLYLNEPYTFDSVEQIKQLIQDVKTNETPDTIFSKIRAQWKKYVSESDNHINLCTGDCVFTFFQDRLGTTHYLFFVADTEAGKSSNLFMFKYLAYRAFLAVDISIANIYRFYGNDFEGIGTLLEDEIDDLDQQPEKLRIYKSGYTKGLKVPKSEKTGDSQGYEQEGYNVFGFKVFAAESMPFSHKAKGFRERTIEMPCSFGLPEYDIQEIINDADDPRHKALLAELNDLRNRLLIYRLVHYHDPIPDIDVDLQAREKQLWKPLLRVFQNGPMTFDTLKKVTVEFIKEYREQKSHTHTAFLVEMISDLVEEKSSYTLATSDIWTRYMKLLPGGELLSKTIYSSPQFGEWSERKLNQLFRDQFKARPPKHHGDKRQLIFDKTFLDRLVRKYRINVNNISNGTDGTVGTDVGLDRHLSQDNSDNKTLKNTEEGTDNSSKNEQTATNYTQQNTEHGSVISDKASHVSHVSQTQTDKRDGETK